MRIEKSSGREDAAQYLSRVIVEKLSQRKSVLFLVPGGSAMAVAVRAGELLATTDLSRLRVMLTDERFGEVGHKDSNWEQLLLLGFSLPGATLFPVLRGHSLEETVRVYDKELEEEILGTDFRIGLFGMGVDGHTAGILPKSTASVATTYVHGYSADPFTRITMTPPAIAKLDVAVLYAMGKDKAHALHELREKRTIRMNPAQALKQARVLTVFSDAV